MLNKVKPHRAVLEKIQKLLNLSHDPANEHEAALAAEKARQLLEKHNLSTGEIKLEGMASSEVRIPVAARIAPYFVILVKSCDLMFDTESIQVTNAWSGNSWYVFCGLPQNVETAKTVLFYFLDSIRSLARARRAILIKKGKRSDRANCRRLESFRLGAASRIHVEVEKFKRGVGTEPNSAAIVRVGNAIARRHIDEKYPGHRTVKRRRSEIDPLSYRMGYSDGGRISIHGPHKILPSSEGA